MLRMTGLFSQSRAVFSNADSLPIPADLRQIGGLLRGCGAGSARRFACFNR
jgi:hypothetical protein